MFLYYKLLPFCNFSFQFSFLLQPHPTLPLPHPTNNPNPIQTQSTYNNLTSTTISTMDFVKDKVNQATETIQGKGAQAKATGDKGELAVKLFLLIWPTDVGFRGR
jgi:hypothetical protein